MKLIDKKTHFPVVEFEGKEVNIPSEIMQWDMENNGIFIPEYLQDEFQNRDRVYLGDPLFQKAFMEVYFRERMDPEEYEWEE